MMRSARRHSSATWASTPRGGWVFRLAVRELEAWLLADREGLAEYMGIPQAAISERPDELDDPTQTLVDLARASKKRAIVRAFVPRPGDSITVGPGYEAAIIEFGRSRWNLHRASRRSPSLRSARDALRDVARKWGRHLHGGRV